MSEKPFSPLRPRTLEDMSVRRLVPDTQREYIRAVKRLATFLGRSPDSATAEELRAFQLSSDRDWRAATAEYELGNRFAPDLIGAAFVHEPQQRPIPEGKHLTVAPDFCEDLRFIPLDAMYELTAARTTVDRSNMPS